MLRNVQEFLNIKKVTWFRLNNTLIFKRGNNKWLIKHSPQRQEYTVFQDGHLVCIVPHSIALIQFIIHCFKTQNNGNRSSGDNY